jgi:hypothetical protein
MKFLIMLYSRPSYEQTTYMGMSEINLLVPKFRSAVVMCEIGGLYSYLAKLPLDGRYGCARSLCGQLRGGCSALLVS